MAAPGLLGTLLLGLFVLAVLQFASGAAGSVAPWLLALTLALLPFALLLRLMLETGTQRAGLHVARMAGARAMQWTLWRERAISAWLLLFCLGYSDFTLSTLLAPPQFPTIFPRVFNLMHYGQSAVLSFSVFVAILAPLATAALTLLLLRHYVRSRVR
jgi:ABC-type Fe3+ transport system permease subunit